LNTIKNSEKKSTGNKSGNISFGNLKIQYLQIQDEIDDAINCVLAKGRFILGEELSAFETEFSKYCGCAFGIGVGSGTEALHLSLLAAGIKSGDEVITVPNTAVPTVSAISFAGAIPKFVDIDLKTYTMDVSRLESAISKKTKAIIPVHLYGQCADMEPILKIAKQNGIVVIEDACQAHGAMYKDKKAGCLGDLGCFSFYPSKNLGAYGDGGMVVTSNPEYSEKIKLLRNYGQVNRYKHKIKGYNSRLDEIQAVILRVKLKYLDKWNKARREKAHLYAALLGKINGITLPSEAQYSKHVYHLFVIRCSQRDSLQAFLAERGIETMIHYPIPVHFQDSYQDLGYKKGDFMISELSAGSILSLPIYPEFPEENISIIAETIGEYIAGTLK